MGSIPQFDRRHVLARRPETTVAFGSGQAALRSVLGPKDFLRQINLLRGAGIFLYSAKGNLRQTLPFLTEELVRSLILKMRQREVSLPVQVEIADVFFGQRMFMAMMEGIFEETLVFQRGRENTTREPIVYAIFPSGQVAGPAGPKGRARIVHIPRGQSARGWAKAEQLETKVAFLSAKGTASILARQETESRLAALGELSEALAKEGSMEEIERVFVEGMVRHIGATLVKVYNVDDAGEVIADKAYQLSGGEIEALTGEDNPSHFKGGRTPEQYTNEMMGTIMRARERILVEPNPATNPLCRGFESEPFVSIREERDGKPHRIYIIEVSDAEKLSRLRPTFHFIRSTHQIVATAKERLWRRAVDSIIQEIEAVVGSCRSSRKVVDEVLKLLPELFRVSGSSVEKILAIRRGGDGLRKVRENFPTEEILPERERAIAAEIDGQTSLSSFVADQGQNIRCTSTGEFQAVQARGVALSGGARGSVLAVPIVGREKDSEQGRLGALVVTSSSRNAFTPQQEVVLTRIGKIMGKAITECQRLERKIQKDKDFPAAYSGAYVAEEILPGLIEESLASGKKLSAAFFDLDWFKACNSAFGWSIVDKHILGPTVELIAGLIRDLDILARFGGDEFYLLFPETDREAVRQACERLLRAVKDNELVFQVTPGEIDASIARTVKRQLNRLAQGLRALLSPLSLRRKVVQFLSQQKEFIRANRQLRDAMIKREEIKYEFRHATTLKSVEIVKEPDGSYAREKDGSYKLEVKMRLSASIGATEHREGEDGETLIKRAGDAAGVAKRTKGSVVVR